MNNTHNTAAARVDEILAVDGFSNVVLDEDGAFAGHGPFFASKQWPEAGTLDRSKAIACEMVEPTDIEASTGWFFGDIPAGCESPWIEA
jgi:hypothetical protein